MPKVCLISHLHLSTNPRLWKEALALHDAGYEVCIITTWTSNQKLAEDRKILTGYSIAYKCAVNLMQGSNGAYVFCIKVAKRLALLARQYLHVDSNWLLGANPLAYLQMALAENADLYIAHAEFGFVIGKMLVNKNKQVGFDFEDWYSKDYMVSTRPVTLLQQLEQFALAHGAYCSCPSESMAAAINTAYNTNRKFDIIYNGFSVNEKSEEHIAARKNALIWFSQTIGPGRGLEKLMQALKNLPTSIELHLLGNIDAKYQHHLSSIFPVDSGHTLFFHKPVAHQALVPFLQSFTIGLALEEPYPESRNTTITNKILQYLQAGLQVLATNTLGQREVASHFNEAIKVVDIHDIDAWTQGLQQLLKLPLMYHAAIDEKFLHIFSWEAQEKKFLQIVAQLITNSNKNNKAATRLQNAMV